MKRLLVGFALLAASTAVQAKETTWTGATSNEFAADSNWTNGAPAPGDTAVFNLTGDSIVITGGFDLRSEDMILEVNHSGPTCALHSQMQWTGAGRLVKRGNGILSFGTVENNGDFTGGLRLERGDVYIYRPDNAWSISIGCSVGVVEVVTTGRADDPMITLANWCSRLDNPIVVRGTCAPGRAVLSQADEGYLAGTYTAECDSVIRVMSGTTLNLYGNLDSGTNTLTVQASDANGRVSLDSASRRATVKGSLATSGAGSALIYARGLDADATLTVGNRAFLYAAWAGNVSIDGSGAVLTVGNDKGAQGSLAGTASVSIGNGGKLKLADGATVSVEALKLDGESVAAGIHAASDYPDYLEGDATLLVGCKTWTGESSGLLSDSKNWSDGVAPKPGDMVIFAKSVTLSDEDYDFGSKGLSIMVNGASTVLTCHTSFAGSGTLVKSGEGIIRFDREHNGSFTGGLCMQSGALSVVNPGNVWTVTIGASANVIELVMTGTASDPRIGLDNYSCGLGNAVVVSGTADPAQVTINAADESFFKGNLSGETDVRFRTSAGDRTISLLGNVSLPGKTFIAETSGTKDALQFGYYNDRSWTYITDKTVVGSLTTCGNGCVRLYSAGTDETAVLTVQCTTWLYQPWAGRAINISGTRLYVAGIGGIKGSLAPETVVNVTNGGKIVLNTADRQSVARLYVDGRHVPSGIYSAETLPDVIEGSGIIKIGQPGTIIFVK